LRPSTTSGGDSIAWSRAGLAAADSHAAASRYANLTIADDELGVSADVDAKREAQASAAA
jgi:hypothetical protein